MAPMLRPEAIGRNTLRHLETPLIRMGRRTDAHGMKLRRISVACVRSTAQTATDAATITPARNTAGATEGTSNSRNYHRAPLTTADAV